MSRDKIYCATSFGKEGLKLYGAEMVNSFIEHWPKDVMLKVYLDDITDKDQLPSADNVQYLALDDPNLRAFKDRNAHDPRKHGLPNFNENDSGYFGKNNEGKWKFQYDAIRFCHKVFAMGQCANSSPDIALWLDGDTKTFAPVDRDRINSWLPEGKFAGFLHRPQSFTETGFHIFDMNHEIAIPFFQIWINYYKTDGIFQLDAWTDCHTYDAARLRFDQKHWFDLSPPTIDTPNGHVFINGALGEVMDHMKGKRKLQGKSNKRDLYINRTETYWRDK